MSERVALILLCCALVAVGGVAWWLTLQPPLQVDVSPLETLPPAVDDWSSIDLAVDDRVAEELAADFNIQRVYRHPTGHLVWLYVGYYSTERGGRPEHMPRSCYTGAGWEVLEANVLPVAGGHVQEFLVRRAGEHRLVHFWFRSHRRGGLTGGVDLGLDRVIGKLTTGRADGALIRISTPLRDLADAPAARSRLASFRGGLVPQIEARWPVERAAGSRADAARRPATGPGEPASERPRGDEREHASANGVGFGKAHHLRDDAGHTHTCRACRTRPDRVPGLARRERAQTFSRRSGKGSPIGLPSGRIRKAE